MRKTGNFGRKRLCGMHSSRRNRLGKVGIVLLFLLCLAQPVSAMDYTAPTAPDSVDGLVEYEPESFGAGLWRIIKEGIAAAMPEMADACGVCICITAVLLLISVLKGIASEQAQMLDWVAAIAVGTVLLSRTNVLIRMGAETVSQMSEYGKLLLPVMTAALAAQGGLQSSAALYAGTAMFDTLLGTAVAKLLVPLVYIFLALAIAGSATGQELLGKLRDFVKWLVGWLLKGSLYIFTGYMTVTGVVSGTADAATVKATKLTISGMVPVVGGILSDASEAIVVGAGVMKSAAGVYGLLVILALWLTPFLQIGLQYLLLKLTAALCATFEIKRASDLLQDFSAAMGLLLAMTGTVCLFLLISTICFMKGVG